MEVSFSHFQISGPPVKNESVNQHRNLGGSALGFITEFQECPSGRVVLTSQTYDSERKMDKAVEPLLAMLIDGVKRVPPSQEVEFRKRGIV